MADGEELIALQICWDGAEMFNRRTNQSIWTITKSILNFPPELIAAGQITHRSSLRVFR